jgi:hypothetical protein
VSNAVLFGTDVNLYKAGPNRLKTDNSFECSLPVNSSSSTVLVSGSNNRVEARPINPQIWNTSDVFVKGSSLSANYIIKSTDNSGSIGNSVIFETANSVGINTNNVSETLTVNGNIRGNFIFRKIPTSVIELTGTRYTFLSGDTNKFLMLNSNTSSVTAGIPAGLPAGTEINFTQYGTKTIYLSAGPGVTLNSADGRNRLRTRFSSATIVSVQLNEWLLFGDIWLDAYDI